MQPCLHRNILASGLFLFFLLVAAQPLRASDLSDYSMQDLAAGPNGADDGRSFITLLPTLPWNNPNVIDPIGDAPNAMQDITAVYVDEDESNVYFRINFSGTGDSAEPFTRYVYVLIDGKIGGKKRVAKNVHADIPWDLLIKLKNPDDLAMYNMRELVTIDIRNFSSHPNARVMGFYIEKRFIEPVILLSNARFQVFTQDKATNRFGDGTAVFHLHNETKAIPDISRMFESVGVTQTAPEGDTEATGIAAGETNSKEQTETKNGTLQYITQTVWLVPQWLLLIAGMMLVVFVCASIILPSWRRAAREKFSYASRTSRAVSAKKPKVKSRFRHKKQRKVLTAKRKSAPTKRKGRKKEKKRKKR
ncbi:hypothetical protein HZB03_05625 [Candidatus Woesearchaeota archaeon]|nr:hypothetical protein [Candidatus Woesearchaeota archaeon]